MIRSNYLVHVFAAVALAFAATSVAAEPVRTVATSTLRSDQTVAPPTDLAPTADRYAERERGAKDQAEFRGGKGYVVIGLSTTAAIVLIVLILVLL